MGAEAKTRLTLAGLLLVTLFAFEQLFADGSYAGPALLGAMIASGAVIAARRLGAGAVVTLLASALALVWYCSVVFAIDKTLYGLPTPAAIATLAHALALAYEASQVDFAPVPVRPGYVIMVVAALWGVATFAEVGTFRWRRPLVASVGPIALFSFVAIVGEGDRKSVV